MSNHITLPIIFANSFKLSLDSNTNLIKLCYLPPILTPEQNERQAEYITQQILEILAKEPNK